MSCSTRSGTKEFVAMLEDHYGVKISQSDWHDLRQWASKETDVTRRKLTDKEIYESLQEYTDHIEWQERGSTYLYKKLPLFHGAYDPTKEYDEDSYLSRQDIKDAEDRTIALVQQVSGKVTEGTLNTIINLPHKREEFLELLKEVRDARRGVVPHEETFEPRHGYNITVTQRDDGKWTAFIAKTEPVHGAQSIIMDGDTEYDERPSESDLHDYVDTWLGM